ncbi:hypothetical protein L195_g061642, partial [Trifolium pratense]
FVNFMGMVGPGVFLVKSSYNLLVEELRSDDELGEEVAVIFDQKNLAQSKVILFAWQLLYDRIPTRINHDFGEFLFRMHLGSVSKLSCGPVF